MVAGGTKPAAAQASDAADRCTPDVMRLCNEFIPDADRIVVCLKAKRRQLIAVVRERAVGAAAVRKRRRSTARGVTKPDPPAFAQDNLNKAQRPACPGRPAARHGTVFAGGLCSRLNGAKRHAATVRVCHAVRRCGVCGDSHGRRRSTIRTYRSDDTLLRIGPYAFEGGKTLNLTVGIGSSAFRRADDPPNVIWTLGDRGPNIACKDMKEVAGVELTAAARSRTAASIRRRPTRRRSIA